MTHEISYYLIDCDDPSHVQSCVDNIERDFASYQTFATSFNDTFDALQHAHAHIERNDVTLHIRAIPRDYRIASYRIHTITRNHAHDTRNHAH